MKNVKVVVAALSLMLLSACASGGQTHMHDALDHLRQARADLEAAEENKGGHRAKAIEACEHAIEQTKAGIAFANNH